MRGFLFLLALMAAGAADATPFRPSDDALVLERLPAGFLAPPRSKRQLDPTVAATLARAYIERSRAEADPRMLGYAQGVLMPWWKAADAPTDIVLLRATLKQARHEFDAALIDLDAVIAQRADSPQAWLTRATILRVQGKYPEAVASCSRLHGIADAFVENLCVASIAGLAGKPDGELPQLEALQPAVSRQPLAVQAWFLAELAEAHERGARWSDAEAAYRQAQSQFPDDIGLRAAYADFLLDRRRAQDALALTQGHERVDALRLRELLARVQLGEPHADIEAAIGSAFEAAHRRNEDLHLREESRFVLEVRKDPASALALAQRNWTIQHEYWDARLLLECALAAGRPQSARPVLDWIRDSHWRDARIASLLARIGSS